MDFAHYTDDPVSLAVELVNSYGWVSGDEYLGSTEALAEFVASTAGASASELPPPRPGDLPRVHELRSRLREVFAAADAESAAKEVNSVLAAYGASPHLSTHGGTPHLHFEPNRDDLTDWLGVITAMGLASVIADQGFLRLGICTADTCDDVYIDTSRNRSRLHCSPTCRTRENVAAHRQRRRDEETTEPSG